MMELSEDQISQMLSEFKNNWKTAETIENVVKDARSVSEFAMKLDLLGFDEDMIPEPFRKLREKIG